MFPDVEFTAQQINLEPGDVLLAFTDGVTEARDINRHFFSEKRLLSLLEQPVTSAAALLRRIEESVRNYTGPADQTDDITMIALRRELLSEA